MASDLNSILFIKVYKYSEISVLAKFSDITRTLQCDKFSSLLKKELNKLNPEFKEEHSIDSIIESEDCEELLPDSLFSDAEGLEICKLNFNLFASPTSRPMAITYAISFKSLPECMVKEKHKNMIKRIIYTYLM